MATTHPHVLAGVSVLVWRTDEHGVPHFLVGRRTGSHGAGTWALPGGKMDWGEDVIATAARELREETGLEVASYDMAALDVVTNDVFEAEDKHFVTLYAAVRAPRDWTARLCEPEKCICWGWVSEPQMRALEPKFGPLANLLAQTPALDALVSEWLPKRTLTPEEAEAAHRGAVFTQNRYTGAQQADFRACRGTVLGAQIAGPGGSNMAFF